MTAKEIIELALNWSNGDPELCAEMAVALEEIRHESYAKGFRDALESAQRTSK